MSIEQPIGVPLSAKDQEAAEAARVELAKRVVHVQMFAPGETEAKCSIKVEKGEADERGLLPLTMLFDYPDMKPVKGWTVIGDGLDAVIDSVSGRDLTCRVPLKAATAPLVAEPPAEVPAHG